MLPRLQMPQVAVMGHRERWDTAIHELVAR